MEYFESYIDGEFVRGEASFKSLDPAMEQPWVKIAEARENDVNRAVAAAKKAFHDPSWRNLNATQRGKLLYKLADLVEKNASELARLETADTGKIIRETSSQIAYVADYYRYYAGLADKIEGAVLPIDKTEMQVILKREPIGVVALIIPWNSQLFLSAVKIGPALAAGCTVVVKASEDGPTPLLAFGRLVHEAGFPKGVVNIITGNGKDCGAVLSSHPDIAHIAFTGGTETARHIIRNSANNLASTSLELGGKSPFIVFKDADIESAVNTQVAAVFAATGQSCVAGSRLIIQRSIKDKFLKRLKEKAEKIVIGNPQDMATEIGPLATKRQLERIEKLVADSIKAGAKLVTGGKRAKETGYYYLPTILDCDGIDSPSLVNEFFGPVLSVVSFETEEEAVNLANDTEFGLASGVFTNRLSLAHRMIDAIHSGIVWVNTYRAVSPIAPFGGYGISGHGREGGIEAALDYTTTKTVWVRTSDAPIPDPFVMR